MLQPRMLSSFLLPFLLFLSGLIGTSHDAHEAFHDGHAVEPKVRVLESLQGDINIRDYRCRDPILCCPTSQLLHGL